MNKYSLDFDKKASKDLLSLDKSVRNFILDELENFINFFDETYEKELIKITKIKALQGEYKDIRGYLIEKNFLDLGANFFIYKINELNPSMKFQVVSVHQIIAIEELLKNKLIETKYNEKMLKNLKKKTHKS